MKKSIFIFSLFFMLPLLSVAQNNTEKMEVMMKMLSLRNSLIAKDSVTLSGLLADDVTYGHTNGLMQTKSQLIRSVMSGEQDYKSIEPMDMNIRIFDNTGIVNLKSKVGLMYQGKPLDIDMSITLTWIKINGDWKLEARQSVKL